MSLELFGYKTLREKINQEKKWLKNNFADCPYKYNPEASWRENAVICRLSVLAAYCKAFGIDQILNREFNDALAEEIKQLGLKPVLEVNAGSGDLARALRNRGIDIIAVDDYKKPLPERVLNSDFLPQKMNYREAIARYQPRLVICNWMPAGEDWTRDFRAAETIRAYILIGEEDRTSWGEYPGWRSRVLKEPNRWSLCRLDHGVDFKRPELWWRHAKVVAFERS
ncbi:hypothetical protein IT084_05230 [Desulfallas sp. Bu1-1]|jgi:hypothetical protein|uniref:hypothetical protein n=1 Tax=Desulfallas sp. Bu1-1 TaxID=2787620 RepID=UPI00189F9F8A|nr:hypothetical protein [Desulfallas sp. Bu1-1]MBF7082381.1 hypothetical protein [Desulfallas sp. Bu1-1]